MGEIIYILGASVNQVVKDWDGLSPPLSNNFFKIALRKEKFKNKYYTSRMQNVYDYIEKYFKKTQEDLAKSSFDLELCFTLLENQIKSAIQEDKEDELKRLATIRVNLISFMAELLSGFEIFTIKSPIMQNFGKRVLNEEPTIITFNYDCIVENVIESASGMNPPPESFLTDVPYKETELPDELLVYSNNKWNRPLEYGFKFDEIELNRQVCHSLLGDQNFISCLRMSSIQNLY